MMLLLLNNANGKQFFHFSLSLFHFYLYLCTRLQEKGRLAQLV